MTLPNPADLRDAAEFVMRGPLPTSWSEEQRRYLAHCLTRSAELRPLEQAVLIAAGEWEQDPFVSRVSSVLQLRAAVQAYRAAVRTQGGGT